MYISCTLPESFEISTEVGIYKRKQESHKKRKHAFDQEKKQNDKGEEKRKKTRPRPRK